jgi:exopolyphosphatase/guanosine-5'-triphosphate,3'-diphosphate pyrophosphatase
LTERPRRIAAIDLGSNSFHMALAEVDQHGSKTYHREKRKVRLAAGLNRAQQLDHASIERALQALAVFGQILEDFEPDEVRAVGTYTFRTASNIDLLTQAAYQHLPYQIEVLSGTEEARLIYQGISHDQHLEDLTLVIDIGGGSTELVIGRGHHPVLLHSCNMGCVSLTERFFPGGVITEAGFDQAILFSEQQLEAIRVRYINLGWQGCIGSSGTIKALAACAEAMGLSNGELNSDILKTIKSELIKAGTAQDITLPGINEDRTPVICGGLAVLIAAFDLLHIDQLLFSSAALREGLLCESRERMQQQDIRQNSVKQLSRRFSCDTLQADRVENTALEIFNAVSESWHFDSEDYRKLLSWACQLHEVGFQIHHIGSHKHAAYIVQQSALAGFTAEQQSTLAFILLNQRKSLKIDQLPRLVCLQQQSVFRLILILRLSIRLNQFRQSETHHSFQVSADAKGLNLVFQPLWLKRQQLFSADLLAESEQFAPLGINLTYRFLPPGT